VVGGWVVGWKPCMAKGHSKWNWMLASVYVAGSFVIISIKDIILFKEKLKISFLKLQLLL